MRAEPIEREGNQRCNPGMQASWVLHMHILIKLYIGDSLVN